MTKRLPLLFFIGIFSLLAACSPTSQEPEVSAEATQPDSSEPTSPPTEQEATPSVNTDVPDFDIVTLLPPDAIPAIDNPVYYSAAEADSEYAPDEQVLGVVFNGEARAYSTGLLSSHEIVNDTVGGRKIAVTW